VKEGLYDKDFIEENAFGFSDWTSPEGESHEGFANMLIAKYSPENVAGITGIESEEIMSLARDFSRAKAPVAICGKGKGDLNGGLFEFMAVRALNALMGNINKSGGLFIQDPLPLAPLPDIEMDLIAQNGLGNRRLDRDGEKAYPFTHSLFQKFTDAILGEKESPIDTLLVFSSNPAFTLPDGGDFRRALEKIPFIASFSSYHDETAYMADIILPDHIYLEKTDDVIWPSGIQYPMYGLTRPVVDPVYDTRNSGDVIIQIAERMGGSVKNSFPWKDYKEVLKTRVKGLFDSGVGLTSYDNSMPPWKESVSANDIRPDYNSFEEMWNKIKSGGLWYRPLNRNKTPEILFNSPTGKFEFYSKRLEAAISDTGLKSNGIGATGDEAFMPHFESPHSEVEGKAYPLQMVPYEIINLSSGPFPSPPYLSKTLFDDQLCKDDSFAEINPDTAVELDLKDGERVIVESEKGRVTVRLNIFAGAMPGVVYIPVGLGHRAYDGFIRGKGANPNDIINGGMDPLSGHSVWWNTPVRIIKA
jgi:anaerobic selenocysteine-containing dehydrogenase